MTAPLTAAELDALAALEAKATPGPWEDRGLRMAGPEGEGLARIESDDDRAFLVALRNAAPALLAIARVAARPARRRSSGTGPACGSRPSVSTFSE